MTTGIIFWLSWIPIAIGVGVHIYKLALPYLTTREAFEAIKLKLEMEGPTARLRAPQIFAWGTRTAAEDLLPSIIENLPAKPSIEQICEKIWLLMFPEDVVEIPLKIAEMFSLSTSLKYRMLKIPSLGIIIGIIMLGLWWLALIIIVIKIILYWIARRSKLLYFCRSLTRLVAEDIQELIRTQE